MIEHGIRPERVTKPIQLLSAWLIGLFVTNGSFLVGAQQIANPTWGSAMLLIACVANVPLFIGALFLLQTKFRPQMQEDSFYSKYLDEQRKYNAPRAHVPSQTTEAAMEETVKKIVQSIGEAAQGKQKPIKKILEDSRLEQLRDKHGGTRALSELFKSPGTWAVVVDTWATHDAFKSELEGMLSDGLLSGSSDNFEAVRLTRLGRSVAIAAESKGLLFSQKKAKFWEKQHKQMLKGFKVIHKSEGETDNSDTTESDESDEKSGD